MTLRKRLYLDIFMSALLAFEMFFELTGDVLHEVIGLVFFVTIIVHLALSAKWARGMARAAGAGKMTRKAKAHVALAIVLLLAVVPLAASSIAISHILSGAGANFTVVFPYLTWAAIHSAAAYTTCVLTVVHLAMHWQSFAKAFQVPYSPQRRRAIGMGIGAVTGISALALGVAGMGAVKAYGLFDSSQSLGDESGQDDEKFAVTDSVPTEEPEEESEESRTSSGSANYDYEETSSSSSGNSGSESEKPAPSAPPASSESSSSSSSTTVTGNCTLCKKRCPLSNPGCDRPYEAGLI